LVDCEAWNTEEDGKRSRFLDGRVEAYRTNARAVPLVAGKIVPEAASSRADYEARILTLRVLTTKVE
jgi:hypothetical protein